MQHDMTTGPIRGHVLRMTIFMLVGMFTQTLYALVDIYWVSRLGKEAVAAVSIATNLMFVVLAASQTLSVGAVALVSQAFGRKDEVAVQRLFNQAQCLSLVAGVLYLLLMLALKNEYVGRLASDAQTAALAGSFLDWFLPSQGLLFVMTGLGSALRGIGNVKTGLQAQVGSVLLNMLLAPFLIFGWITHHPFGVAGAAMASFIATLAATIGLVLYLMRKSTYLRINFAQWLPDFALWRRMLGIGLPSGAEFLLMTVILSVIYIVVRPFGAQAQAGLGIGMRIMQAGFMPAVALSFSVAAVAGQNYGAGSFTRVRQTFTEGAKLTIGFMLLFTLVSEIGAAAMMRVFSKEPAVIEVGADYLHFIAVNYVASGLVFVAAGMFQGLGNTLPSLMASASRLITFVLPVLWLSRQTGFQLHEVWWMSVASVVVQTIIGLSLLRREMNRRLREAPSGETLAAAASS
jgi:putative MATE family efflux protein